MKYLFILLLSFFLFGCISVSHDLGSGYVLGYGTDNFQRIIFFQKNEGGCEISFYTDSIKTLRYFKNEEGIITAYVSRVAVDGKYLIIDQKPLDSICECKQECINLKYPPSDNRRSAALCETGIRSARFHNYYIIDKERNSIYGPILSENLIKKLKSLVLRQI